MSINPQDAKLFDRSVYANATYGLEHVPYDEVQTLLLGLKLERLQRQEGACWLDTGVGKDGLDLSGGERQQILLARAIFQARPLVLLDEATSALDAQTEAAVLPCCRAAVAARAPARYHHRGGQPQAACAAGGVSHAGTGPGCDALKPRLSARRPRPRPPRLAWAAGSARSGRSAAGTDTTIRGRCRRRRA